MVDICQNTYRECTIPREYPNVNYGFCVIIMWRSIDRIPSQRGMLMGVGSSGHVGQGSMTTL